MSWHQALDAALDRAGAGGTVTVDGRDGEQATLDVTRVGPIGVRLRGLRVEHAKARSVATEAARLVEQVRALGQPLRPIEVDPALGGAILRTTPEHGRWFDVTQSPHGTQVRRRIAGEDGAPTTVDFDLTREQLGELLRTLDGSG